MRNKALVLSVLLLSIIVQGDPLPESIKEPMRRVLSVLRSCDASLYPIGEAELNEKEFRPQGFIQDVKGYSAESNGYQATLFSSERTFSISLKFPRSRGEGIDTQRLDKLGLKIVDRTFEQFFSKSSLSMDPIKEEVINRNNGQKKLEYKLYGGWFLYEKRSFEPYVIFIKLDPDGKLFEYTLTAPRKNKKVVFSTESMSKKTREQAIRAFLESAGHADSPFSVHDERDLFEDLDLLGFKTQGVTRGEKFQIRVGSPDSEMIALYMVRYSPVVGEVVYSLQAF